MTSTEGIWLSISDYSRYKNVSVSTIRRHIKNNILKVRQEEGKYLIYVPNPERIRQREDEELLRTRLELELLRSQLRQLQEENQELRMLVDLYEGQSAETLPELPPQLPEYHDH
jgi:cell shape-determining protein MreC